MTPKFRAWLPRQGKMVDVTKITFVEGKVNCVFYSAKYSSDTISACYEGITFELMQSTGVKDCNGKEIYEGDIVFWQWGEIGDNIYTNCGKEIVDSDFHNLAMLEEVDRLLVIGNIYENPELKKELIDD